MYNFKSIENTPFAIIKQEEENGNKYFIVIGNHLVSEEMNSEEECIKKINEKDWDLLLNTMLAMSLNVYKQESNKEEENGNH